MAKTVLITGGSRGIGRELVALCLAQHCRVIATASSEQSVAAAREQYPAANWRVCDMRRADSIAQFARQLAGQPLDVVIHNAGVQQARDLFCVGDEAISVEEETMVNFTAPVILTRLLFGNVLQAAGTWVFVSSGLAIAPKQSSPVYCANKAGLRAFCKSFNGQVQKHAANIKVCEAILPLVDTEMTHGRGSGKISAAQAAAEIWRGALKGRREIHVGKMRLVMRLRALLPNLVENIMLKA